MKKIDFERIYNEYVEAMCTIKDWGHIYGYGLADALYKGMTNVEELKQVELPELWNGETMEKIDKELGEYASELLDDDVYEYCIGDGIADYWNEHVPAGGPWIYSNDENKIIALGKQYTRE